MNSIHLTVHPPVGEVLTAQLVPGQYTLGSGEGAQIQLPYEGVAEQHVVLWLEETRAVVEALVEGVQVNSYAITERVEAPFPVSVEFAGVMLVVEQSAVEPEVATADSSQEIQITLPPKEPKAGSSSTAAPISAASQCAPTLVSPRSGPPPRIGGGRKTGPSPSAPQPEGGSGDEAPLQGSYKLVREIARGGMGKIYFGEDPQLNREVAIKVSSLSEGGMDPRFSKEAEVLAQLAHPNIVPIYAIGVDSQRRPYYSMKLVKGRTLQAVLDGLRKGNVELVREYPLSRLLSIFLKVCDAMAFAHSKGFLHRDLKPENVMVGEFGEVLVMDWGLAKRVGSGEEIARSAGGSSGSGGAMETFGMTMEGDVMGTPQYMSPEQAQGMVAELDVRSDVYALGAILYAILTLRPPIEGKTLDEVLTRVKGGQISSMVTRRGGKEKVVLESPAAMDRRVPEALQAVTLKAMALDRERRYARVEDLARDLEAYQNGFATQAENAGALRQLVLFIKRNKGVSSAVAVFLIAAAGFVVKLTASERRALSAMEASRREAAKAELMLAEVADAEGNAEQVRISLSKVPEDLRDLTWEYLYEKSDFADFKIPPPEGSDWLEVEECVEDPESVLGVQTNGQVSLINTVTGRVSPLWKAERKGFQLHSIAASADRRLLAVAWKKENGIEVEVRTLLEGQPVGSPTVARLERDLERLTRRGTLIEPSSTAVLIISLGGERGRKVGEVWDLKDGTQLWERKGIVVARFSKDGRSVFAVNTENELERIGAADGVTVSKWEAGRRIVPEAGFPATAEVGPDGSFVVSGKHQADERRVRRVDFPGGKLVWEANQDLGRSLGVHVGAQKGILGNLDICSPLGWRLRLYNDRSGDLVASHAFLTKPDDDFRAYRRMAFSQRGVAIAFKSRVLVWQTGERVKPVTRLGGHGGVLALDGKLFLKVSGNPGSLDLTVANRSRDPLGGVGLQGWSAAAISMDASGGRVGLRGHTQAAAYRLNEKGIETLWELKNLGWVEGGFALHPSEDRLWMKDKVLEFSSGRELTTLKVQNLNFTATERTEPKSWSRSGGWVGSKHVVATMLQGSQGEAVSDAGGNQWLALWNSETGEMEAKIATPRLASLGISPDGQWIAEGGKDKRVRIRRGRDLGVEREMRVHDEEVRSVVWHPSLPLFITSAKGVVRIWSSQTWRKVEEFRLNDAVRSLQVVSSGRELGVDTPGGVFLYAPESFRAAVAP